MQISEAVDYMARIGAPVRPVTAKRMLALNWRWYLPSCGQLLTDADLVETAENDRSLRA